jgi:hypothetical protein
MTNQTSWDTYKVVSKKASNIKLNNLTMTCIAHYTQRDKLSINKKADIMSAFSWFQTN